MQVLAHVPHPGSKVLLAFTSWVNHLESTPEQSGLYSTELERMRRGRHSGVTSRVACGEGGPTER